MDGSTPSTPQTATIIQKWRTKLHLSKQRFAELADVSATYVRTIEAGVDDDGRPVVPSAGIILKLASGLARAGATVAEERQAYAELMAAAGYVDASVVETLALPRTGSDSAVPSAQIAPPSPLPSAPPLHSVERGLGGEGGASAPLPPGGRGDGGEGPAVALRDPRLLDHLVPLLERWDDFSADDQATLLGVARLIAERGEFYPDARKP